MQTTRLQILEVLKKRGVATVDELARVVGLTPMGIRQHLSVLQSSDLISSEEVRRKIGRPHLAYRLTDRAEDIFPKSYHLLSDWLLDDIERMGGKAKVRETILSLAGRLIEENAERMAGLSPADRIKEAATVIKEMAVMAELEVENNTYRLAVYNCPYLLVARRHPEICLLPATVLSGLTGVSVERKECVLKGSHRCLHELNVDGPPPEANADARQQEWVH